MPVEPGRRRDELSLLVLLGVLAEVPDVPVVVLGEQSQLRLLELTRAPVSLPDDDVAHAAYLLGEVGDRVSHAMRDAPAFFSCRPFEDELRSRLEREPRVVDRGRTVEVLGIEVLRGDFLEGGLVAGSPRAPSPPQAEAMSTRSDAARAGGSTGSQHSNAPPSCRSCGSGADRGQVRASRSAGTATARRTG